ncbi:MAG: hypothetical protein B6U85_01045 [Desulfurococcales archaeon ex4484_42]|nr:MAG: hypothetical protein B6U85_01045 [Desulfurococcales archaeon ex4484_42]
MFNKKVKIRFIEIIVVTLVVTAFITYEISYVSGIDDYISDECWYVSAARNILRKIFNVTPKFTDENITITIEIVSPIDNEQYNNWLYDLKNFVTYGLKGKVLKDESYYVYNDQGNYLPALCVEIPKENLKFVHLAPHEKQYAVGYCYPNANGVLDYLNLEHPPLVKYVIGLMLYLVGDKPILWRIPSILLAAAILILMYLSIRKIIPETNTAIVLGVIAMLVTIFDITFRSLSMVAMLDIYVAFFTYLTYYLALNGLMLPAIITLGLSASSKFNGAFPFLALIAKAIKDFDLYRIILFIILIFMIPITLFLVLSIPLINYLGFETWWANGVIGAISWHLSIKTLGGPPQSAPWEWFLGINPFPLHLVYDPNTGQWVADLIARGNPPLYILTLVLSIFLIPVFKDLPDEGFTYVYTWSTYLFYIVIWFLGARTQYSFYMVQLVPLMYTLLFMEIWYLMTPLNRVLQVLKAWKELLKSLFNVLSKIPK